MNRNRWRDVRRIGQFVLDGLAAWKCRELAEQSSIVAVLAWSLFVLSALSASPSVGAAVGTTAGQFSVSPKGSASYKIPIIIPPGTAGLQPKLSFEYSNMGPNGLMGVGWSISGLSSISRCPATLAQDGFVNGVDFDQYDRLCLDGERLVPVSGAYGGPSTEYRTEIDKFSKIVASGGLNDSASSFQVRTKDGLIYSYGIADSAFRVPTRNEVYVWAVKRIEDRVGNYMTVSYFQDPVTFEHYVDHIDYTINDSAGQNVAFNTVKFIYENRSDVTERYIVSTNQTSGSKQKIKVTRRLRYLETYADSGLVRQYQLGYQHGSTSNLSRLSSLTECARGQLGLDCLPATTFTWQEDVGGFSLDAGLRPPASTTSGDVMLGDWVDVNGDGLVDLVQSYGSTRATWLNLGTGWQQSSSYQLPTAMFSGESTLGRFVDLNADSLPDWLAMNSSGARDAYINTGTGWQLDVTYRPPVSLYADKLAIGEVTDLNGDGLPDLVQSRNGIGNAAYLNNMTACSDVSCHWQLAPNYTPPQTMFIEPGAQQSEFADVNGDGLPDYIHSSVIFGPHSRATYLNTGTGWERAAHYDLPTAMFGQGKKRGEIIDVNGDGLNDFVVACTNLMEDCCGGFVDNTIQTYINTGGRWAADSTYNLRAYLYGNNAHASLLTDVNGDGRPDQLVAAQSYLRATYINTLSSTCTGTSCHWIGNSSYLSPAFLLDDRIRTRGTVADLSGDGIADIAIAWNSSRSAYVNAGPLPDLMRTITNGLGARVEIDYVALTKAPYTRDVVNSYPEQTVVGPLHVVTQYRVSDGSGGLRSYEYEYSGLRLNLHGRSLLGFETVQEKDLAKGTVETRTYRQDFPFTGMLSEIRHEEIGGGLLKTIQQSLDMKVAGSGGQYNFPFVKQNTVKEYEIGAGFIPVRTAITDNVYDNFGNLESETVAIYKGDTPSLDRHLSQTTVAYDNDTSIWCLGLVTRKQIRNTLPSGQFETRVVTSDYNNSNCLLVSEVAEPDSPSLSLVTTYTYDPFGNRTSVQLSGLGSQTRITATDFDSRGQFPESVTNPEGHLEIYDYDPRHGNKTRLQDPNGPQTTWGYDPFGRDAIESRADGSSVVTAYLPCAVECASDGAMTIRNTHSNGMVTIETRDVLDRVTGQSKTGFDGTWIRELTEYDQQGRKKRISVSHYAGDNAHWTTYTYDVFDRVSIENAPSSQVSPTGRVTRFDYNGLITRQTDAKNNVTEREINVMGRVIRVTNAQGHSTTYGFDPFSNNSRVTDAAGNVVTVTYDIRGRKTLMADPDMGTWRYEYNVYGDLTKQTNAKSQVVTVSYDRLGRMKQRDEIEAVTTWTYDTKWIGKLSNEVMVPKQVGVSDFTRTLDYDPIGRPIKETTRIDGIDYLVQTNYDSESRPIRLIYPSNLKIKHSYTSFGYLHKVCKPANAADITPCSSTDFTYWQLGHMDARGNVDQESLGNGVSTSRLFDQARGHIDAVVSGRNNGTEVQSLSYAWDLMGNLQKRKDENQTGLSETFTYDEIYRVEESRLNNTPNIAISYNNIGNITSKTGVGTYIYGSRPHAVTQISGTRTTSFQYDDNGNMISGFNRTIEWTSNNQPRRIRQIRGEQAQGDYGDIPQGGSTNPPLVDQSLALTPGKVYTPALDDDGTFTVEWGDHPPAERLCFNCVGYLESFDHFELQVSRRKDFSDAFNIYSGTARTFQAIGFKKGYYHFRVRAVYTHMTRPFLISGGDYEPQPGTTYGAYYAGPNVTHVVNGGSNEPVDSDGDGVANSLDQCPNTPSGTEVGSNGCPLVANESHFYYAPNRARYKHSTSRTSPPDSTTIYYVGDLFERHYRGATVENKHFIRAGGRVVVIHNLQNATETTQYLHRDHLGSVDVMTDEQGLSIERTSFDAFGKRRPTTWGNDSSDNLLYNQTYRTVRGYTGHEQLDHVGLIHMNGRVYDPILGRFTSPDPFVQFPENTQGLNRYTYVNNNPLSYTDPSGFFLEGITAAVSQAADAFAIAVGLSDKAPKQSQSKDASGKSMKGFAEGAISTNGTVSKGDVGSQSVNAGSNASRDEKAAEILGTAVGVSNTVAEAIVPGFYSGRSAVNAYFSEQYGMSAINTVIGTAEVAAAVFSGGTTAMVIGGVRLAPLVGRQVVQRAATSTADNLSNAGAKTATSQAIVPYYPPNQGFVGAPAKASLIPGTVVDRYGSTGGSFLSPQGTAPWARALPHGVEIRTLNTFEVLKPIDVDAGRAAPWFNQPGGGMQYDLGARTVQDLINSGHLGPVR